MPSSPLSEPIADVRVGTYATTGHAALSRSWREIGNAVNAVLGGGGVMVPDYRWRDATSVTNTYTLTYWFQPRSQAVQRHWVVRIQTKTGTNTITAGSASLSFLTASVGATEEAAFELVEDLTAQSSQGGEVTITLDGTGDTPDFRGAYCYEVPRATLSDSNADGGVYLPGLEAGQPVKRRSARRIIEALDGSHDEIGSKTYINWAAPVSPTLDSTITTMSTTFTGVWTAAMPVLARKKLRTDTTATITVKVRAKVSAGTGEIRVTTGAGSTSAQSVTNTSYAWFTFTCTVDCTDVASSDGRQTAGTPAWDTIQVDMRHTTGTPNSIWVSSVSAFDKPFDPLSLSPTVWLRGDLGLTTSSGKVTGWADQSGNGNDFAEDTGSDGPGSIIALNGETGVRFNGATHLISAASITLPTNYVVWMVGKLRDSSATRTVWSDAGGTELGEILSGGTFRFTSGGATSTTSGSVVNAVTTLMLDASAYPDATPYVDNVAITGITGGADSSPVSGSFYIGSDASMGTESEFELYEFAIFDSANVGTNERAQLQAYARKRYYDEDFTPLDLEPFTWCRSDSGLAVSQWDDLSGNMRHFVQATGSAQPTIVTDAETGYSALEFASGDYMTLTATLPTSPVLWAVFEVDDATSTGYVFGGDMGSVSEVTIIGHAVTTGYLTGTIADTSFTGVTDISGDGPVSVVLRCDAYPSGTVVMNGVQESTATGTGSFGTGVIALGNDGTTTAPLNGRVFEIGIFDGDKMTAASYAALNAYALRRYGISDTESIALLDSDYSALSDADGTLLLDVT